MPVLLYAGLSTAPVVLHTKNRELQIAAIANLVAWTCYVAYDTRTGRLKQARFMKEHGLW